MSEKVVLERDDVRRTLQRIAHEIAEKNPDPEGLAIVGIHTRGALLARRCSGRLPKPCRFRRRFLRLRQGLDPLSTRLLQDRTLRTLNPFAWRSPDGRRLFSSGKGNGMSRSLPSLPHDHE